MQQAPGSVQVVDGKACNRQQCQRQPAAVVDQPATVQHAQADAKQEFVDDVVAVEAAEHAQPAQYLAGQQQRGGDQQLVMTLAHQEGQAEQQVEEHLEVQRPAHVQGRVQAIATWVFRRDEQQRQEQVPPVKRLMWHPLAECQ
ncbi:hypothetical protein D3C79_827010 [compost metagenome]